MTYKLNTLKTFHDRWIFVCMWMILAFIMMLLPVCWGNNQQEIEEEVQEREPWILTEDGDHQLMPPVESDTEHERFKELAAAYWLDASMFRTVENHYWLKEWLVLCITIAETSWGSRWYGKSNPWNVGNNDRWDRVQYAFFETWLEKIGQTLTNKNLGRKQTLWCLSNAGSCT